MLQDGGAIDLGRTPSLLRTEQLADPELMALAAQNRAGASMGPSTNVDGERVA